jgi:peptidoglycan/LPS O-acetylase OafA/YrhL
MRSSSGRYDPRLDHIRALAIFMVFSWHFLHADDRIPTTYVPSFPPLSLFEEGHLGVALFLTLSGFLFARLSRGRVPNWRRFFAARALRIVPLLTVVIAIAWLLSIVTHDTFGLSDVLLGVVLPTWPNGAWSITVEIHCYLLFPALLALQRRGTAWPSLVVAAMVAIRTAIWLHDGSLYPIGYDTIVGRLDQFVIGMMVEDVTARRRGTALKLGLALAVVAFVGFWHVVNLRGGLATATSPLWIVLPPLQGLGCGAAIGLYDTIEARLPALIDRPLARVGEVSYSLYLLHPFVYVWESRRLARLGFPLDDFPTAMALTLAAFLAVVPLAWLSYRLIERPFLRARPTYLDPAASAAGRGAAVATASTSQG